jgi:hypothetical protein
MSYILKIGADFPNGAWTMRSGFLDYSGFGNTATTVSGSPKYQLPLAAGSDTAVLFDTSFVLKTLAKPFRPGRERASFSLETWISPSTGASGTTRIYSHSGKNDGLLWDGSTLTFTIIYSDTSTRSVSYKPDVLMSMHVVAVYSNGDLSLYINGALVSSLEWNEETDTALGFITATDQDYLYTGQTAASPVVVDTLAIYSDPLNASQVYDHYTFGKIVNLSTAVSTAFDGELLLAAGDEADPLIEETYTTVEDWELGEFINCSANTDGLSPDEDSAGAYQDAYWYTSFPIDAFPTLDRIQFVWTSTAPVIVETSLNGTSWNVVNNTQSTPTVTSATSPTNAILEVRVHFVASATQVTMSSLTITGFELNVIPTARTQAVTLMGYSSTKPILESSNLSDFGGTYVEGGVKIATDTSGDVLQPKSIEMLIRPTTSGQIFDFRNSGGSGNPYLNLNVATWTGAGTIYVNGVLLSPISNGIPIGQWSLIHVAMSSVLTVDMRVGLKWDNSVPAKMQIAHIAFYAAQLTAQNALDIKNSYFGLVTNRKTGGGTSVGTSIPVAYAYDWSITAAGG